MEKTLPAEPTFAEVCDIARSLLAGFDGYFIERISHESGTDSRLLVYLQERPHRPDVIIHLDDVRYVSMGGVSDLDGCFVDGIELEYIPSGQSQWPDGLEWLGSRPSGIPDLARLRIKGPAHLEAVAAMIQIFVAANGDRLEGGERPSGD